jgi:copper resistance protein D
LINPEVTLMLARMAQDSCAILLWGGFAYLAFLVPRPHSVMLCGTLRPSLISLALLCATLLILPIQSARLGEGWPDAFNVGNLHDILLESSLGLSWAAQLAAATFLAVVAATTPQRLRLFAVAAGVFLATRSLIGHAVMLQGPTGIILRASYLIHVLAAGAWVGALLPVLRIMRAIDAHPTEVQATALRRFSVAGHVAVALTLLSGLVNASLIRGRFFPKPASPYDALLGLKIALVAAMVLIAVVNRYLIVPRLAAKPGAVPAMRLLTAAEILLAGFVLLIVNLFSTMDPH